MSKIITNPIKVSSTGEVFRNYLTLIRGMHTLTEGEMDFLSALLDRRLEYVDKIIDKDVLDEYVLTKPSIREELQEQFKFDKPTRIPNILSVFRKKGVLDGNSFNDAFCPKIDKNFTSIELVFRINKDV